MKSTLGEKDQLWMEVTSTLVSLASKLGLPSLLNKIKNCKKGRELDRIRKDYLTRSAFVSFQQASLSVLFQNNALCEELIAHCHKGDLAKSEVVNTFLYSSKETPSEGRCTDAEKLVSDYFDEVAAVIYQPIDKKNEPLSAAVQEGITETRELQSDVQQSHKQLEAKFDALAASLTEQLGFSSLTLLINAIEDGSVQFADFESAVEADRSNSISGKYLSAYLSLCKGEIPRFDIPDLRVIGAPLASSLASLAVSSGQLEIAVRILEPFDEGTNCAQAVKEVIRNSNCFEEMKQYEIPADSPFIPFADVLNAELTFMNKAYVTASDQFAICEGRLNPVAKCHSDISRICKAIYYSFTSITPSDVKNFAGGFPLWGSDSLKHEYGEILENVLDLIDDTNTEEIISSLPEETLQYLPNAQLQAEINTCGDLDKLKYFCQMSLEKRLFSAFFTCAEKLISEDSSSIPWVKQLVEKESQDTLKSNFLFFLFYIEKLNPRISYSEYKHYESGYKSFPHFHLPAYRLFKSNYPEEACNHIELALSQMANGQTLPCPEYSEEWVGFLQENQRDSQVIDIVKRFLPVIPARAFKSIISAIAQPIEKSDLAKELFESLEQSGNKDPELACLIAQYYGFVANDQLKALKYAKLSFNEHPSLEAALSLAYASLNLSLDLPEEVEQYALCQKDTQLDMFVAEQYRRAKKDSRADYLLKRAIFDNRPDSHRAIAAYGSSHLGDPEKGKPIQIGPDSCVHLERAGSENLVVAFHSEPDLISAEGIVALGMQNYSTTSPQYLGLRSHVVGDRVQLDSEYWEVVEIDYIDDVIGKKTIEIIAEDPATVVFSSPNGDIEDVIRQISEFMEEQKQQNNVYVSGIQVHNDTVVFLGIETGHTLYPIKPFEFIINVLKGEDMPFRRMEIGSSFPITGDEDFLLSYNAVILLAALEKLGLDSDSITDRCLITISTKNRLQLDIQDYSDSLYGAGKMISVDGRATLMQYDDATKQELSEICSNTLGFLNKLKTVELAQIDELPSSFPFLDQNTLGDMETAKQNGMFYVTEDCFQALFSDISDNAPHRCSLYSLLIALNLRNAALFVLPKAMRDWGAEPCVDINVTNAVIHVFESFLHENEASLDNGQDT